LAVTPPIKRPDRGKTLFFATSGLLAILALIVVGLKFIPVISPRVSEIQVKTNPNGAILFIDGRMRGATPVKIVDLHPGAHQFRIIKPGYFTMERNVQVLPRSSDTVEWELLPAPATPVFLQVIRYTTPGGKLSTCHRQTI
jgi:hypothetical protein